MSNPPDPFSPDGEPQVTFIPASVPVGAVPSVPDRPRAKVVTPEDISDLSLTALAYMKRVLNGEEPGATPGQKAMIAQWVLEKHSGKPKQEVVTSSSLGIAEVIDALARLNASAVPGGGTPPHNSGEREVLELSPAPEDPIDQWVNENVPILGSEKT